MAKCLHCNNAAFARGVCMNHYMIAYRKKTSGLATDAELIAVGAWLSTAGIPRAFGGELDRRIANLRQDEARKSRKRSRRRTAKTT